jgi:biopolymer transport protein ExbB
MKIWRQMIDLPWESWNEKLNRSRRHVIWLLVVGLFALPAVLPSVAQQPAEPGETLSVEEAENPGAPAATNSATSDETDPTNKQRTMLDTLADGGFIGLLLMLLSIVAVGFIVEHFMTIRMNNLMPDRVVHDL